MKLSIFDLDGTLLKTNSFHQFALFAHLHLYPRSRLGRLPGILLRRRMRRLTSEEFKDALLAPLARVPVEHVQHQLPRFIHRLRRQLFPKALKELESHLREHRVLIATGALDLYAAPLLAPYGVTEIIATKLSFSAGCYTGRIVRPEILGVSKRNAVQEWLRRSGSGNFDQVMFFTDCLSDRPLLDIVDAPYIVNNRQSATPNYGFLDWT